MTELSDFENLRRATPDYVSRALSATRTIIEHSLNTPGPSTDVRGVIIPPGKSFKESYATNNREAMQAALQAGNTHHDITRIEADIQLDNCLLALDLEQNNHVRAWMYRSRRGSDKTPQRELLHNLVSPAHMFLPGDPTSPDTSPPRIYIELLTAEQFERNPSSITSGGLGPGNIAATKIRTAVAPKCTRQDALDLNRSVYYYHDRKIKGLLGVLELISRTQS